MFVSQDICITSDLKIWANDQSQDHVSTSSIIQRDGLAILRFYNAVGVHSFSNYPNSSFRYFQKILDRKHKSHYFSVNLV